MKNSNISPQEHNEILLRAYFGKEIEEGRIVIKYDGRGFPHAYTAALGMEVRPGD